MLRSFITLLFVCFTAPAFSSSFEIRDYGDNRCEMGPARVADLELDLTAKIGGENFSTYNVDYSAYEENLHKAANAIRKLAGACLKDSIEDCQTIIDTVSKWQKAGYVTAKSSFDSADWWEESFQSNEFFVSMIEAISIAHKRLNVDIGDSMTKWLHNALHKNRKYEKHSKNNHRTVWVISAAKTALLTKQKVKVGFNKKSAAELIDWELSFQFARMKKDGALPGEAMRGRRAVFYTGRELGYLIALLEMGEKIGTGSYEKFEPKLHKAVNFMLDAIDDPKVIYPYAKKMKASPKGNPLDQDYGKSKGELRGTFSFAKVYASRFKEHPNVKRMTGHPVVGRFITEDIKVTKGFGIDTGCLNPTVKIGAVDIDLSNSSKPEQTSRIPKNCKFQITRKSGTNTQKLVLNRGELAIGSDGAVIFGKNDGYKLKTKKGQRKDLLQNAADLKFVDDRLKGDFLTYHGKDSAEPELVTISHLKPNADKFDGKYPFVYSSGADGELTIYLCKDPE